MECEMEQKTMKNQTVTKDNRFLRYVLATVTCLISCFERFVKFINKTAYIHIALTGKNFCASARDGFFLLLRNPFKFGLVHGLSEIFMFMGKMLVTVGTAILCYFILIYLEYYEENLYSPFSPIILILFIAFGISLMFMGIYGLGADTIVQCFLVDQEIQEKVNGGAAQFCPEELREFFSNNSNRPSNTPKVAPDTSF